MTFEDPVIYPEDDFRKEYRGQVKDGYVLHGEGTLILKSGKEFSGTWEEGSLQGQQEQI